MEMEKREKIFLFFPFSFDKSNNPKIKRAYRRFDAKRLTSMRVFGCQARARNESERRWEPARVHHRPILMYSVLDGSFFTLHRVKRVDPIIGQPRSVRPEKRGHGKHHSTGLPVSDYHSRMASRSLQVGVEAPFIDQTTHIAG